MAGTIQFSTRLASTYLGGPAVVTTDRDMPTVTPYHEVGQDELAMYQKGLAAAAGNKSRDFLTKESVKYHPVVKPNGTCTIRVAVEKDGRQINPDPTGSQNDPVLVTLPVSTLKRLVLNPADGRYQFNQKASVVFSESVALVPTEGPCPVTDTLGKWFFDYLMDDASVDDKSEKHVLFLLFPDVGKVKKTLPAMKQWFAEKWDDVLEENIGPRAKTIYESLRATFLINNWVRWRERRDGFSGAFIRDDKTAEFFVEMRAFADTLPACDKATLHGALDELETQWAVSLESGDFPQMIAPPRVLDSSGKVMTRVEALKTVKGDGALAAVTVAIEGIRVSDKGKLLYDVSLASVQILVNGTDRDAAVAFDATKLFAGASTEPEKPAEPEKPVEPEKPAEPEAQQTNGDVSDQEFEPPATQQVDDEGSTQEFEPPATQQVDDEGSAQDPMEVVQDPTEVDYSEQVAVKRSGKKQSGRGKPKKVRTAD